MKRSSGYGEGSLSGTSLQIGERSVLLHEKLSESQRSVVYRCTDRTNWPFAVKLVQMSEARSLEQLDSEMKRWSKLANCQHIVRLAAYEVSPSREFIILTELCDETLIGELERYAVSGLSSDFIANVFGAVLRGITEMHQKSIMHRALTPEHVIASAGTWKLCSFRCSTSKCYDLSDMDEGVMATAKGDIRVSTTREYRAPEMVDLFRGQIIDQRSDIWALGCLLYRMCTLQDVFPGGKKLEILHGKYTWKQSWEVDPLFKDMVAQCLQSDPRDRPTVGDLLGRLESKFTISATVPKSVSWEASVTRSRSRPANLREASCDTVIDPDAYLKLLLDVRPPRKVHQSDESDIEMEDDEDSVSASMSMDNVETMDFEFASDGDDLEDDAAPSSIDVGITITGLINNDDGEQQNGASVDACFDLFKNAGSLSGSGALGALIDFDLDPAVDAPAEVVPQTRPRHLVARSSIDLLFEPVETTPEDDMVTEMKTSPHEVGVRLLKMEHLGLADTCYRLVQQSDDAPLFLLTLARECGPNASKVLLAIPPLKSCPLNEYIAQRKNLAASYPMFEGNFSLATFATENKDRLPPPGAAPISVKVVQDLQRTLDILLAAFRASPLQILADDAVSLYQSSSYIMAKLKQFKVSVGFLDTATIPMSRNQHNLIKKAFEKSDVKAKFPDQPFDFNDPVIQKRLRFPAALNNYA